MRLQLSTMNFHIKGGSQADLTLAIQAFDEKYLTYRGLCFRQIFYNLSGSCETVKVSKKIIADCDCEVTDFGMSNSNPLGRSCEVLPYWHYKLLKVGVWMLLPYKGRLSCLKFCVFFYVKVLEICSKVKQCIFQT